MTVGASPKGAPRQDLRAPDLAAHVPQLAQAWLAQEPDRRVRTLPGALVFADVSGFTRLTERLMAAGKVGAEQMSDLLNDAFGPLLDLSAARGGDLVSWGGDAVLLLFTGDHHVERAAAVAFEARQSIRRLADTGGPRLRLSSGVWSGDVQLAFVGEAPRLLLVVGAAARGVVSAESAAGAGEIVVSPAVAAAVPGCVRLRPDGNHLLVRRPEAPAVLALPAQRGSGADLTGLLDPQLVAHLSEHAEDAGHRPVATGFVGVDGFERLLGDERALGQVLHEVVARTASAVRAQGAQLVAGDVAAGGLKLMVTAGAPAQVEDPPGRLLRGLRTALDAAPDAVGVRAGATWGRVFAGEFGSSTRRTWSVVGDCVNLAARLQAAAERGALVASRELAGSAAVGVSAHPLAPLRLKGKQAAVNAVQVSAVGGVVGSKQLPLVGRDEELALLLDRLARCVTGGRLVEVVAEAGLGKSRLLAELEQRCDLPVTRLDGDRHLSAMPYAVWQQLLAELVPGDLRPWLAEVAPHLLPWAPLLALVTGHATPRTDEVDALEEALRPQVLARVVSELLEAVLPGPRLVVVNDVHHLDAGSRQLLGRLAADVPQRSWLLVVTRRPEAPSAVDDAPWVERLELQPLSASACEDLLAAAAPRALPASRVVQLSARAAGQPLYLLQLLEVMGAGGGLVDEELPATLEAALAVGVDQLPAALRSLVRAAALLGTVVDLPLLEAVLGAAGQRVDPADLAQLPGAQGLLVERDGELRFRHDLLRDAAYEGLPFALRRRLHAAAARVLLGRGAPAAVLAEHHWQAQEWHAAYLACLQAGDSARAEYANADAARQYARARECARRLRGAVLDAEVAALLESLAEVWTDLGELAAARRSLDEARRRARGDQARLARLHLRTAVHHKLTGSHRAGMAQVTRGLRLVAATPEQGALRAELEEHYAWTLQFQGRGAEALAWAHRAHRTAVDAGALAIGARATMLTCWIGLDHGETDQVAALQEALVVLQHHGSPRDQGRALNMLGACWYFLDRPDLAADCYRQSADAYRRGGREADAATQEANLAEVLLDQGQAAEAAAALRRPMRVWAGAGLPSELAFGELLLGRAAAAQGDLVLARRHLEAAQAQSAALGEESEAATAQARLAELCLLEGAPDRALAAVAAADTRAAASSTVALLDRVRAEALAALDRPAGEPSAIRS